MNLFLAVDASTSSITAMLPAVEVTSNGLVTLRGYLELLGASDLSFFPPIELLLCPHALCSVTPLLRLCLCSRTMIMIMPLALGFGHFYSMFYLAPKRSTGPPLVSALSSWNH